MYYFLVLLIFTAYVKHEVSARDICPNVTKLGNCVKDAESHWGIDRNKKAENFNKWCCFQWEAFECQMNVGKHCVGEYDVKKFNVSMTAIKKDIEEDCREYPAHKCGDLMANSFGNNKELITHINHIIEEVKNTTCIAGTVLPEKIDNCRDTAHSYLYMDPDKVLNEDKLHCCVAWKTQSCIEKIVDFICIKSQVAEVKKILTDYQLVFEGNFCKHHLRSATKCE